MVTLSDRMGIIQTRPSNTDYGGMLLPMNSSNQPVLVLIRRILGNSGKGVLVLPL